MRYLLLPLLLTISCIGQSGLRSPAFVANLKPAAGAATFSFGLDTIAANADTWGADSGIWMRVQASASGTLQKAFVYVNNTAAVEAKVCVYGVDTDSTLNAEDALLGTSDAIVGGGSAGWWPVGGATMSGGSITSGSYYWLVIFLDTSSPTWAVRTENSSTVVYKVTAGMHDSPPADGSTITASGAGAYGRISVYVTAQ